VGVKVILNGLRAGLHKMEIRVKSTDVIETFFPKLTKRQFVVLVIIRNENK
jgi:hypothetical protein